MDLITTDKNLEEMMLTDYGSDSDERLYGYQIEKQIKGGTKLYIFRNLNPEALSKLLEKYGRLENFSLAPSASASLVSTLS